MRSLTFIPVLFFSLLAECGAVERNAAADAIIDSVDSRLNEDDIYGAFKILEQNSGINKDVLRECRGQVMQNRPGAHVVAGKTLGFERVYSLSLGSMVRRDIVVEGLERGAIIWIYTFYISPVGSVSVIGFSTDDAANVEKYVIGSAGVLNEVKAK